MSDCGSVAPPRLTVTEFTNDAVPVANCPVVYEGLVSPKPVPNNETISPGLAGDPPATMAASATSDPVPACSAAMLMEFGNTKNAGANACNVFRVATALPTPFGDPGFKRTVSVTGPVPVNSGICALI